MSSFPFIPYKTIWQLFLEILNYSSTFETVVPHEILSYKKISKSFQYFMLLLIFKLSLTLSWICPHLPGSPLPLPLVLPFVPVWIFHIAAAAGAWCRRLSSHCVFAVWVRWYAAPWRVVCRDRRVAADASRPPACLSVQLHLTGCDIAISTHTNRNTCIYTHIAAVVWIPRIQHKGH